VRGKAKLLAANLREATDEQLSGVGECCHLATRKFDPRREANVAGQSFAERFGRVESGARIEKGFQRLGVCLELGGVCADVWRSAHVSAFRSGNSDQFWQRTLA